MYLVDTNIWLERLLEQARADEVGRFLDHVTTDQLLITDFSFHSIGVICGRLGQRTAFLIFVQDVLIDGAVSVVGLQSVHMTQVIDVMSAYQLDFDDAYQYVAAKQHHATLVSFDTDFDRTERGRTTPATILSAASEESR